MSSTANIYEGPETLLPVVNVAGNLFEEVQEAVAAQTVFNLISFNYTPGTNSISVYRKSAGALGGEMLRRAVDYVETDNNTVTVTVPATLGDLYFFQSYAINLVTPPTVFNGMPVGGTVDQVLTKISGSDYAADWDDPPSNASLLDAARSNIIAAATIDLSPIASVTRNILITGDTAIDGFVIATGQVWAVRFSGIPILNNSIALVTQRGANIQVAAGATCFIRATADNQVEILSYAEPYKPASLVDIAAIQTTVDSLAGSTYLYNQANFS